jgi:plastocyanin
VHYEGVVPEPKQLVMRSAPQCAAAHPEAVYDQSLVVKGGRLANAVAWIKGGLENWTFAPASEPVVIDQVGCLYLPRVVTAMVGQPVDFRNSDPEAHNVHGRPSVVKGWNFMMSRRGSIRTLTFDKPEVAVPIGCDIHPWMTGFVAVVPNPYAGVTTDEGEVILRNVPPGDYTVGVWHEKLGTKEQPVKLAPSGEASLTVIFGPTN